MANPHYCKDTERLVKILIKQDCRIQKKTASKFTIYAPDGVTMYIAHMGNRGRSYHPLRRWAQNQGLKV